VKTVFVGGSRHISRLNSEVKARLDRLINQNWSLLFGGANGADRAVQQYLRHHDYSNVQVFCMQGHCRNNVGKWPVVEIGAAKKNLRGAEFYSIKDREMTNLASIGLMLWDGKSFGTLANIVRLIDQRKPVVVYHSKLREFNNLKTLSDLHAFLRQCGTDAERTFESIGESGERVLF